MSLKQAKQGSEQTCKRPIQTDPVEPPSAGKQLSRPQVGSSNPHGVPGEDVPTSRIGHKGRRLREEPELADALWAEPFPSVNVPAQTIWEAAPQHQTPPARMPKSYAELTLPSYRKKWNTFCAGSFATHEAAERNDVQKAKRLRPDVFSATREETFPTVYKEHFWEAQGGVPRLLQPTSWPANPPNSDLKSVPILQYAGSVDQLDGLGGQPIVPRFKGQSFADQAAVSHMVNGYPSRSLALSGGITQAAPLHVGALKEYPAYLLQVEKNEKEGWIRSGCRRNPPFVPIRVLPENIVIRGGKRRLTVDPAIEWEPWKDVPPVNQISDADEFYVLKMVRLGQVGRAMAILLLTGVGIDATVLDAIAYYRRNGIQGLESWLWCYFRKDGMANDLRVPFGGKSWPKNLSRQSNFHCWCIGNILEEADAEYPPSDPKIIEFMRRRREESVRQEGSVSPHDRCWAVLFWIAMFIDDLIVLSTRDALHSASDGKVCTWIPPGQTDLVVFRRCDLHGIKSKEYLESVGHGSELSKAQVPWTTEQRKRRAVVYIGGDFQMAGRCLTMPKLKRQAYLVECKELLEDGKKHNRFEFDSLNSTTHKILHSCLFTPGGRSHTCHLLKALRTEYRMKNNGVPVSKSVTEDLAWWVTTYSADIPLSMPLASRETFIASDAPNVSIYYGDASREIGTQKFSGWGFWMIKDETLYLAAGEWTQTELVDWSINVLEFRTMNMAMEVIFAKFKSQYFWEFTDNTAAEAVAESLNSPKAGMSQLARERDEFMRTNDIFAISERITSKANLWADWLSRGDAQLVLDAAMVLNLRVEWLEVPPAIRKENAWVVRSG